jgi:hypothetical protein
VGLVFSGVSKNNSIRGAAQHQNLLNFCLRSTVKVAAIIHQGFEYPIVVVGLDCVENIHHGQVLLEDLEPLNCRFSIYYKESILLSLGHDLPGSVEHGVFVDLRVISESLLDESLLCFHIGNANVHFY